MNLYNQFMAGPSDQQRNNNGLLETGIGNLSLSDNDYPSRQQPNNPRNAQRGSVDLYEWDGNIIELFLRVDIHYLIQVVKRRQEKSLLLLHLPSNCYQMKSMREGWLEKMLI